MDIPWRAALLIVAAVFVVFLIAKMLPVRSRKGGGSAALGAAKAKVRDAKTERARAEALCEAAEASMALPFGVTRGAAYYLRAMRADPAWPDSVERAARALSHRRSRVLEKMLWRRLAATAWDSAHAPVVRALMTALAEVSRNVRGQVAQSQVLDRLLAGEVLPAKKPA